jgi:hypothetical protein
MYFLGFLKDAFVLHGFSQFIVTPFVPFLHGAYLLEKLCRISKSFLNGYVCKTHIKSRPFVSLAGSRRFQLSQSVATDPCRVTRGDRRLPALKQLEKELGMLLLVI